MEFTTKYTSEVYNTLIDHFKLFVNNDDRFFDVKYVIDGTPQFSELYIGMIYRLISKYPELIESQESKEKLYNIIINYARVFAEPYFSDYKCDHKDYNKSIDEFINDIWYEENGCSFEVGESNGGWNLSSHKCYQVKEILKMLKNH
jgi:hypothetical protein